MVNKFFDVVGRSPWVISNIDHVVGECPATPELAISLCMCVNPFTPESDQCQNSPAASQEIWHHTVWRTWLFIAYSDEKWLYYKFSLHHSYNRFLKGWENTLFELRSERVNDVAAISKLQLHLLFFQLTRKWMCAFMFPVLIGCPRELEPSWWKR